MLHKNQREYERVLHPSSICESSSPVYQSFIYPHQCANIFKEYSYSLSVKGWLFFASTVDHIQCLNFGSTAR